MLHKLGWALLVGYAGLAWLRRRERREVVRSVLRRAETVVTPWRAGELAVAVGWPCEAVLATVETLIRDGLLDVLESENDGKPVRLYDVKPSSPIYF